MHDPQYRLSIAWQNVAYNQPAHTGFFLGHDMETPPVPNAYYINADTPTSINTETLVLAEFIYPNPVTDGIIYFNESIPEIQSVVIKSLSGRVLYSSNNPTSNNINISSFASGIYLVEATSKNGTVTQKVIKR